MSKTRQQDQDQRRQPKAPNKRARIKEARYQQERDQGLLPLPDPPRYLPMG